jgi:hypothetical protein
MIGPKAGYLNLMPARRNVPVHPRIAGSHGGGAKVRAV